MKQLLPLFILSISLLISCNHQNPELQDMNLSKQVVSTTGESTDTGDITIDIPQRLSERNFARTANLNFKANDALNAVMESEDKVRSLGGYVGLSVITNSVLDSADVQKTEDSLIRTMRYAIRARLILHVPDDKLDTLLAGLSKVSKTMYHREIHCDDVSIRQLDNILKKKRAENANQRLKKDIDQMGKKLSDIGLMEKSIEEKDVDKDDAKIASLTLQDAVKYSTVTVEISQEPFIQYTEMARERIFPEYKTPYLVQLKQSVSFGWEFLKDLTIGISKLWSLILLTVVAFIIYSKWKSSFIKFTKRI